MCGRFSLTPEPSEILAAFPDVTLPPDLVPRYNVAPTQAVLGVTAVGPRGHELRSFHWGLIPSWAKDTKIGSSMINARAETLSSKPGFRSAFQRRRCLVLADGFYEWRKEGKGKKSTPFYIRVKSHHLFAFAGLWEKWRPAEGNPILSCTIVTTTANDMVRGLHERMPVILPPALYQAWLNPDEAEEERLLSLLRPYSESDMEMYQVSDTVNNPRNEVPECVVAVESLRKVH